MKRADAIIAALAGLGVMLVVLVVLTAGGRGPLLAQGVDRSNGFVLLTGRYDNDIDALYLLDERSGQLAVFLTRRGGRDLRLTDVRDLGQDFGIEMQPPPPPKRPYKRPRKGD